MLQLFLRMKGIRGWWGGSRRSKDDEFSQLEHVRKQRRREFRRSMAGRQKDMPTQFYKKGKIDQCKIIDIIEYEKPLRMGLQPVFEEGKDLLFIHPGYLGAGRPIEQHLDVTTEHELRGGIEPENHLICIGKTTSIFQSNLCLSNP